MEQARVWAESPPLSSVLSSSSGTGAADREWLLFGIFGGLCVAVLAVFVLELIRKRVCPLPLHGAAVAV